MSRESDRELIREAVGLLGEDPLTADARDAVHHALQVMHVRLAGPDYDYSLNIESLDRDDIPDAGLSDLATWSTWVVRGERFSGGHIDFQIKKRADRRAAGPPAGARQG